MKIEVLGPGCPKCSTLADNVKTAADGLGLQYQLNKVTDIMEITKYGVMVTPALVVDGEVKASGRVLSPEEIRQILA